MTSLSCILLAVVSVWDYPLRQPLHERLSRQFIAACREGDPETMRETCEKGVKLLPDDPTWRYNLACSLAYYNKADAALDELEKAIDLGFRDAKTIAEDNDLKRLAANPRLAELVEYARTMQTRPILVGPNANVDATGLFGKPVVFGAQNLSWDFDLGCFTAHLKLAQASADGNVGDLYMNRDGGHSRLAVTNFPGLTVVSFDGEGHGKERDLDIPNVRFPYPAFGNCSRAMTAGPYWRSLPRALVTTEVSALNRMMHFYLQNQIWVFPANKDCAPAGNLGDVFASVTPYWFTSAGISWSDQPILRAALEASRSFRSEVKAEIVRRGLLAPTIQALVRKSLRGVTDEASYLSPVAHPTAISGSAIDLPRLKKSAADMSIRSIPPLAVLMVESDEPKDKPLWPELTYQTGFAWAYVLRSADAHRAFTVSAKGSPEYAFAVVHDDRGAAKVERLAPDAVKISLDKSLMTTTNRVDLAVFGRAAGTSWGAPSFVSFAVVDSKAPYSDPALTPLAPPNEEEVKGEAKVKVRGEGEQRSDKHSSVQLSSSPSPKQPTSNLQPGR